jgi:hypothetical protein
MLVEFRACVWSARKLDRSTTDEVVSTKGAAARDAARVNKNLLAGRSELEVISQHVSAMRTKMYTQTMPWSDSGIRLLPSTRFRTFNQWIDSECLTFNTLVEDFLTIYPTLITAQALALGDMFDRSEFPSVDSVRQKFSVGVSYLPVPTSGDWRVQVGQEAQAELTAQLERVAAERVDAAKNYVRDLLREHLHRMSERLTVDIVDGTEKGRRLHDSVLEWGLELTDLVKDLNITADPDIEMARAQLQSAISGVAIDELRKNLNVRTEVKQSVDSVLSKLSW